MNTPLQPRGFALLMALLVLTISATALGVLSRQRLEQVLEVDRAEHRLQAEWITQSAADTLLPQAQQWLTAINQDQPGTPSATWEVKLTDHKVVLRLDNEHAKVQPLFLHQRLHPQDFQAVMEAFIGSQTRYLASHLNQPAMLQASDSSESGNTPFHNGYGLHRGDRQDSPAASGSSWAQVIQSDQLTSDLVWDLGQQFSLFTDGRLYLPHAAPNTIRLLASPPLNPAEIEHLISERDARPDVQSSSLIRAVANQADSRGVREAVQLFTPEAEVYSLWLRVEAGNQVHRAYAVLMPTENVNERNANQREQSFPGLRQRRSTPDMTALESLDNPTHRILQQAL